MEVMRILKCLDCYEFFDAAFRHYFKSYFFDKVGRLHAYMLSSLLVIKIKGQHKLLLHKYYTYIKKSASGN